jgi:TPR repeat protein
MYDRGKGVKQDDFKALKFFQKACDLKPFGKT